MSSVIGNYGTNKQWAVAEVALYSKKYVKTNEVKEFVKKNTWQDFNKKIRRIHTLAESERLNK